MIIVNMMSLKKVMSKIGKDSFSSTDYGGFKLVPSELYDFYFKPSAPKSCSHAKSLGCHESKHYVIDPDGPNGAAQPFSVYCNMTSHNGIGVTVYVKYECLNALLLYHRVDAQTSWLVSRDGRQMEYWGGASRDSGMCACGMTGSCASNASCNCDANKDFWLEDSGLLNYKEDLPVISLRFGDVGDVPDELGYHTLGKLICYVVEFPVIPEAEIRTSTLPLPCITSTPNSSITKRTGTTEVSGCKVKMSINYACKTVNKILDVRYEALGKALFHGPPSRIATAVIKCEPVRKEVVKKILGIVKNEVDDLCSRQKPSMLRKSGKDDLMKFDLQLLCQEWMSKAPLFYSFLLTCSSSKKRALAQSMKIPATPLDHFGAYYYLRGVKGHK
ncbi:hypothetical protein QZH41_007549 [Actinostola sp. cb2023]|nr:hypothetical protein QZH41_007549 [Actinostola sp. cb2023]